MFGLTPQHLASLSSAPGSCCPLLATIRLQLLPSTLISSLTYHHYPGMEEPTFIYSDRSAKLTVLPCVQCGDPVNGFRQCMHCFGHLHRRCGTNAKKGSLRSTYAVCAACAASKNMDEGNMPPQVITLFTDDSSHPMITTNDDALYEENGEEIIPTQDMATNYPELMAGSANTHVSDSTGSDNPTTCISVCGYVEC